MTNIYCMILAESGGGKNKPLQFINQLLIESGCDFLIGDAHPVGDTSLICDLPFQRTRIDVIDEASIFFGSLHSQNRHQSKMGDVYADLYSSAGKFFGGKRIKKQGKDEQRTQTIGRCNSPCVSMLTAMTPTAFEKCVNKETIETGLGARFLYFYDNRTKSPKYSVPLTQIPDHIKDFVRMWRDSDPENQTITFNPSLKTLVFDSKAQLGLRAVHEKINEQSFLKGREHMKAIRNRLFENIVKLSMIDACSVNRSLNPVVMSDSVKWGARAGLAIFNNIERFIDTYVHSGANDQRLNKVFRVIDEAGIDGITRTDLAKKSRMLKSELNQVIATLKDFGQIGEFKPEKTTFYVSHNYFEGV